MLMHTYNRGKQNICLTPCLWAGRSNARECLLAYVCAARALEPPQARDYLGTPGIRSCASVLL